MGSYPTRVMFADLTGAAVGSHASGDAVGTRLSWNILRETGSRGGVLTSVIIGLDSTETPALSLHLFGGAFVAATDDAAAGYVTADMEDYSLGHVAIASGDWSANANNGEATVGGLAIALACHQERNQAGIIYGQLVARGAFTPTNMWIKIGVLVD